MKTKKEAQYTTLGVTIETAKAVKELAKKHNTFVTTIVEEAIKQFTAPKQK